MTQWGLDTLFNPAKRHMDEEKRRLQTTREQLGDSSGGKRIDLESGKVVIRRASDAEEDPDSEGADAAQGAEQVDPAQSVDSTASVSGPTDSPQAGASPESRDAQ